MPNVKEMLIIITGINKCGGIVIPVNFLYKARELRYALKNSKPRVLFTIFIRSLRWNGQVEEYNQGSDIHRESNRGRWR